MNVRQGPESVFDRPPAEIMPALADAKATGENGRVGRELVFWGFEHADGRRVFFFACARRPEFDCATRVSQICPVTTTVLETREASGNTVRRSCRNVAVVSPGEVRPGCVGPTKKARAWPSGSSPAVEHTDNSLFRRCAAQRTLAFDLGSREETMKKIIAMAAAVVALGLLGAGSAQEGHPLKGSWLGEWAGNATSRRQHPARFSIGTAKPSPA